MAENDLVSLEGLREEQGGSREQEVSRQGWETVATATSHRPHPRHRPLC